MKSPLNRLSMGKPSRQWPQASNGAPAYTPHSQRQTITRSTTILGLSTRTATWILAGILLWNLLILVLCIVVASVQGTYDYDWDWYNWYNNVTPTKRAGMVFVWCTLPFVALIVSMHDLIRRHKLTVLWATLSAAAGATLYLTAFLLWGDCAYFSPWQEGLYPVCYHTPTSEYANNGNPIALIFILPWFALGAALTYATLALLALLSLRRQRKAASMRIDRKSLDLVEMGKASNDYSEVSASVYSSELQASSVGEETLPSRPRSTVPSRQLSMANHSTRPPTYYSSGDDSLLTVDEKDEKAGSRVRSVGYA